MRVCHLPWDYRNPYQELLAEGIEQCGVEVIRGGRSTWICRYLNKLRRGDIAHFHWVDAYFNRPSLPFSAIKAFIFLTQVYLLRLLGRKMFFTLHNLDSHELRHPRLENLVIKQVARRSQGVLTHCTYARRAIIDRYGLDANKVHVVPHGNYIDSYPNQVSKQDAREHLGLSDTDDVLLFIGSLRRYKGIENLVEAIRGIENNNLRLVIAGHSDIPEEQEYVLQQSKRDSRIRHYEGYVKDEELQYYLNASDAVALPFTKVLTSGSMILAMSFARPVIVPKVGCLTEVGDTAGAFYIDSEAAPIDALRDAINHAFEDKQRARDVGDQGYRQIEKWNWQKIGKMVNSFYQSV